MKKLNLTFSLLLLASSLFAQKIAGIWYGTLNVRGNSLRLVFHISQTSGIYATTMDSPDQHAMGLAAEKTTVEGNQLTIEATKYAIKYIGNYLPDSNKIKGIFLQGASSIPLELTDKPDIKIAAAQAVRPQDPKDFPYKREEVSFVNPKAGNKLAGTLTMPQGGKVTKIVILITGSGPQNRNEEIAQFNHRPFLVWSDWLTRNGIAVLRYDDRGIAQSTGNFATATTADFADDAEAAVSYIQSRADLRGLSIGLMGHSEGGMIAPMVASRNHAVKFLVLLAGPGVPIAQLMTRQSADQMRLSGAPEDAIKRSSASNARVYDFIVRNKTLDEATFKIQLDTLLNHEIHEMPEGNLEGANVDKVIRQNLARITAPWFRYFLSFNPADYLTQIKCPVLALNGTLDMQVSCEPNLAAIKANLQKAGNKKFEIVPLTGLNHLLQQAKTGGPSEYGESVETVNPVALQKVASWVNQL
jgi:pimeloyl-ACP methyl ester carboxylesterase